MRKMILLKSTVLLSSVLAVLLIAHNAVAVPILTDTVFNPVEYASMFYGDGWLSPGVGGNSYDVKHLGLCVTDTRLYFGLHGGMPLKASDLTSTPDRQPGDFALDIGDDGTYDFGIRFWDASFSLLEAAGGWDSVRYSAHRAAADPFRVSAGYVDRTGGPGDHEIMFGYGMGEYFLEGWVLLDDLGFGLEGLDQDVTGHFTTYCGNDHGETTLSAPAPEPATILLMGSGLLGIIGLRKRSG